METLTETVRVADLETWNPAFFRDILKAVAVVNEEPSMILDPEGLRITEMSPDHYSMVDLHLSRGFFDSFDVIEEYRAGLNVKDLLKMVFNRKTGKLKDSSLSIHLEGLKATFKGTGKLRGSKTLNMFDPHEDDTPTPKIDYAARVRLVTDTLKRVIADCTVDPDMMITVDDDKVLFRCANDDFLEENTLDKYDDSILDLHTDGPQKAFYSLEHLEKFPRALVKIAEAVTVEFSAELPMRISVELPAESHLVYYIPPKTAPHEDQAEAVTVTADDVGRVEEILEAPEPYTCENCGVDVPAAQGQNQVDMVLCETCAALPGADPEPEEIPTVKAIPDPHEDQPVESSPPEVDLDPHEDLSPGELYLKYYAEALARHSAEGA